LYSNYLYFYSTQPRRATRILGRRYALTPTSYKYLDIGISVGAVSYVELILGDNRDTQIVLSFSTWNLLMQRQADVEQFLQSTAPPLSIEDLTIEMLIMHHSKFIKLALCESSLYMKPQTLLHLFNYENCIDHMHNWLCENTYLVNEKFKQFENVLQRVTILLLHTML